MTNEQVFDKGKMALSILNLSFDNPLSCSFLTDGAVSDCSSCPLMDICEWIDEVARWYKDETTAVVKTFSFMQ